MLNPGTYRGAAVEAALSTTSRGTPQVAVRLRLVDPPGQTITWYGFLTDAAIDRTVESLRHMGWQGTDVRDFLAERPLPEGFDQEVEIVVEHEEYEGKTQARVKWINSGGGLAVKNALTEQEADAFAAKMSRHIAALDRAAGRTSATAKPGAARGTTSAQNPFPGRPASARAATPPWGKPQGAQLGPIPSRRRCSTPRRRRTPPATASGPSRRPQERGSAAVLSDPHKVTVAAPAERPEGAAIEPRSPSLMENVMTNPTTTETPAAVEIGKLNDQLLVASRRVAAATVAHEQAKAALDVAQAELSAAEHERGVLHRRLEQILDDEARGRPFDPTPDMPF
jgi:hypothetical protein